MHGATIKIDSVVLKYGTQNIIEVETLVMAEIRGCSQR